MGAFATIPQVGETVPTPSLPNRPRPPLLYTPETVSPLAEGLKAAEPLANILAVQVRHKNILDAEKAVEKIKDGFTQATLDSKQLPGDQQAAYVQQKGSEILKQTTEDPANANISEYLLARGPQLLGSIHREAMRAGAAQTAMEHDTQQKLIGSKLAGIAGSDYTVNQDGSIGEGPESVAAQTKYASVIDQMWPKNPQMAAMYKEDFQNKLTLERAQALARNPDAAHPALLQDFIKANSGKFTPQQESSLLSAQTTAISAPVRTMEANAAASRLAEIQYQQNYIKQNGQPDMDRLNDKMAHRVIDDKDFRGFTGYDYTVATAPDVLDGWHQRIAAANSEDEINGIQRDIGLAGATRQLDGRSASELNLELRQHLTGIKTPAGQANIRARAAIDANYYPETRQDRIMEMRQPGAFARARQQATMAYDAAIYGHPAEAPSFYQKAMEDAVKANPRPSRGGPPAARSPMAPGAPPAITDDDARKIAAYMKAHPEAMPH